MTRANGPVLFDVNALVALSLTNHVHHRAAHLFLGEVTSWCTTPVTESGLARLLLNPAVAGREIPIGEVTALISGFAHDPRWSFIADDTRLSGALVQTRVLTGRRQVTDLHLVNLARRHGARLGSFDRAMLTWLDPADRAVVQLIPA